MSHRSTTTPKNPWIAALLSFLVPGLGHLYVGRLKRGLAVFACLWILFILLAISPITTHFIGLVSITILLIVVILYGIIDAVIIAKKRQQYPKKPYSVWYVYVSIFVIVFLFMQLGYPPLRNQFAKNHFAKSTTSSMSPSLEVGDFFVWSNQPAVERDNIAVYTYPEDGDMVYIARCKAAPGDQFEIREGFVYINDQLADDSKNIKFSYIIDGSLDINHLGIKENEIHWLDAKRMMVELKPEDADNIAKTPQMNTIKPITSDNRHTEDIFPYTESLGWNMDNYGPIIIPQKGEQIKIDKHNAPFYAMVILHNEGVEVTLDEEGLLEMNGKPLDAYTFMQNYYFMMGDNRHNAYDSRFRGLVSEDLIRGKVNYISWSSNWDQVGKAL